MQMLRNGTGMHEAFVEALPGAAWGMAGVGCAWVLVADSRDWTDWRGQGMQLLDDAERGRIARMRNDEVRATLEVAYPLHRLLLGRWLGMRADLVPLWRDPLGCPRVGEKLANTSLSHAGSLIALAVAGPHLIGVDIEPASRVSGMLEIADSICQPAELESLEKFNPKERASALLALWTGKEALLKALGIGFSTGGMTGISLPVAPRVFESATGDRLGITRLDRPSFWSCALACAPDVKVEFATLVPKGVPDSLLAEVGGLIAR